MSLTTDPVAGQAAILFGSALEHLKKHQYPGLSAVGVISCEERTEKNKTSVRDQCTCGSQDIGMVPMTFISAATV